MRQRDRERQRHRQRWSERERERERERQADKDRQIDRPTGEEEEIRNQMFLNINMRINKHAYLTFTMNYSTDPTVTSLQKVTDQICSRL